MPAEHGEGAAQGGAHRVGVALATAGARWLLLPKWRSFCPHCLMLLMSIIFRYNCQTGVKRQKPLSWPLTGSVTSLPVALPTSCRAAISRTLTVVFRVHDGFSSLSSRVTATPSPPTSWLLKMSAAEDPFGCRFSQIEKASFCIGCGSARRPPPADLGCGGVVELARHSTFGVPPERS